MPEPVLTLLKYVFLAILYLFFLRVLRAVWVETREPKAAPLPEPAPVQLAGVGGSAMAPDRGTGIAEEPPAGPEKLVVVGDSPQAGQEFPLGNEMTVGRAAGCAIRLTDDTFVSQIHARVYRQAKAVLVEDLGSTNGTFVNGKKVTVGVQVRKGDRVQFGRTTMEVRK